MKKVNQEFKNRDPFLDALEKAKQTGVLELEPGHVIDFKRPFVCNGILVIPPAENDSKRKGLEVKEIYTIQEAADFFAVHPQTLRRAIAAGKLKAAKLGKDYRISKGDMIAFYVSLGGTTIEPTDPEQSPPAT